MDINHILPPLLGLAWLLPLASFALILLFGPRMGTRRDDTPRYAGHRRRSLTACVLSFDGAGLLALGPSPADAAHGGHGTNRPPPSQRRVVHAGRVRLAADHDRLLHRRPDAGHVLHGHAGGLVHPRLLVRLHARRARRRDRPAGHARPTAQPLQRRGRFHRFFQYLSLFCFSMLGLVVAGNIAMVFVFWELVGICSYLLIGFYIERKSASNGRPTRRSSSTASATSA